MSQIPLAEVMPGLYRDVLDLVANLEARHARVEAARIRAEATRVYSRAWDADAARRLSALCRRAGRATLPRGRRSRYATVLDVLGRRPEARTDLGSEPA